MLDYPVISAKRLGMNIKKLLKENGYSVGELQEMLLLSHPQPIYRWMQGKVLPSVGHLYAMSKIFGVHMEELLEGEGECHIGTHFLILLECLSLHMDGNFLLARLRGYCSHMQPLLLC